MPPTRRLRRRLGGAALLAAPLLLAGCSSGTTFVVDELTSDLSDTSPGDGRCETSDGGCSLRAALEEANASRGADTVELLAGTHETRGELAVSSVVRIEAADAVVTELVDSSRQITSGTALLEATGAVLVVDGVTFRGALVKEPAVGVAIRAAESLVSVEDVLFERMPGKALAVDDSWLTVVDSRFHRVGDVSGVDDGRPGDLIHFPQAVEVRGGSHASIEGSAFDGNSSRSSGALTNRESVVRVGNTTFSDNWGDGEGFPGGSAAISTYGEEAVTRLHHVTLADNRAFRSAAAVEADRGGRVFIRNSLLSDNHVRQLDTPVGVCEDHRATGSSPAGTIVDLGGNVTDAWCGTDRNAPAGTRYAHPSSTYTTTQLEPLAFNGGPTPTHALPWGELAEGFVTTRCRSVDQRDVVRTAPCDAGAYERTEQQAQALVLTEPWELPVLDDADTCELAEQWFEQRGAELLAPVLEDAGIRSDEVPPCRHRTGDEPVTVILEPGEPRTPEASRG